MVRQYVRVLVCLAICFGVSSLLAETTDKQVDWPGWLGPDRNGWVEYFQTPDAWPQKLKQGWQAKVGIGYATPLVVDGLVYQYARQGEDEVLWCFELESGKQVWRKSYAVPFTMGQGGEWHGKGPKGAPIYADGRLFTMSISGILSAWNAENGEQLWSKDYNERFEKPKSTPYWGAATSPIVAGDRVVVHFGNDNRGVLVAFNVETGDEIWSQPKDAPSYSSPLLVEKQGVKQIVEWNHRAVVGIDTKTGKQLWEFPFPHVETNQNMPTPSWHNGRVFVGGENRGVRSVEPVLDGSVWTVKENWHQKDVALDMASAIVNGDYLYGLSHYQKARLFCIDTNTGDVLWQGKPRAGSNATFLSIPGQIIVLNDRGELQVIKADGEDSKSVANYQVSEESTWAAPVLLGDGFLIKDHETLTRWSWGN